MFLLIGPFTKWGGRGGDPPILFFIFLGIFVITILNLIWFDPIGRKGISSLENLANSISLAELRVSWNKQKFFQKSLKCLIILRDLKKLEVDQIKIIFANALHRRRAAAQLWSDRRASVAEQQKWSTGGTQSGLHGGPGWAHGPVWEGGGAAPGGNGTGTLGLCSSVSLFILISRSTTRD